MNPIDELIRHLVPKASHAPSNDSASANDSHHATHYDEMSLDFGSRGNDGSGKDTLVWLLLHRAE